MAICSGFERVFEVGPVFRTENSNTHRHLFEFVGLDAEMEIKEHYFEGCDIIDVLFITIFKHLNKGCKKELETINRQYPFEPLKPFYYCYHSSSIPSPYASIRNCC